MNVLEIDVFSAYFALFDVFSYFSCFLV